MTSSSDHTHAPSESTFTVEDRVLLMALTAQRNEVMDEAAKWRAVAIQERQVTQLLAKRVAELEGESSPNRAARRAKAGKAPLGEAAPVE